MTKILLGQYLDFLKAGDNEVLQAQAITGKKREDILSMKAPELARIVNEFTANAGVKADKKLYKKLELLNDGKRQSFYFHPNLEYMTMAEYMDVNTLLQTFPQSLPSIMAILYRPITAELNNSYLIEDYDSARHLQNADLFRQMSLDAVNGVMVFFYLLKIDLTSSTLDFLSKETETVLAELETLAEDMTATPPQPTA
jgi:hypothetical protein